ncbi:MAG: WbqC family protein [Bacteroidota bacterium]|jgi:hypothetical protein|nr:WbqC family protein [Sphingobacteriales bacterium]
MIASIHQPNFIPWIGFFYKIARSDVFVILDDVQFTKNGFTNRNRIKTRLGESWLTLPVTQSGRFGQNVNECIIQNKPFIISKIIKTIRANYQKAPHFNWLFSELESSFFSETNALSILNINLIKIICGKLEINTPILISSNLNDISGESTERLISICKSIGATEYLFGFGASTYQDNFAFEKSGITPVKTNFSHPSYPQLWNDFIPNLSIIDLLFNVGPESRTIFKK